MANSKISALTSATTPLAGTETLPIVQSSTTKQVSVANLTVGRAVTGASFKASSTSANVYAEVPDGSGGGQALMKAGDAAGRYFAMRGTSYDYDPAFLSSGATNVTMKNLAAQATSMTWGSTGDITINVGNILGASGKSFIANGNRTYYSAAGFWDDTIQGNACGVGCFGGPAIGPLNGSGNATDNTINFGSATYRWKTVYAGTGTINTSDANEKQEIQELDAAELAVAKKIKTLIKKYRFKDAVLEKGDAARIHFGVIAQDVEAAFSEQNLDASRYGIFCKDEWYEVDGKSMDENMSNFSAETPNAIKKTRLGVRYEELFAFVIAAM